MTRRGATKALIVAYLYQAKEARGLGRIRRYMWLQHGRKASATKNALQVLVRDGAIERVKKGYYRCTPSEPAVPAEQ